MSGLAGTNLDWRVCGSNLDEVFLIFSYMYMDIP